MLRRRPSTDSNHSNHSGGGVSGHDAEAKESSRSLLAQSLLNSNRGSNNTNGNGNSNEEEDEEVDFKVHDIPKLLLHSYCMHLAVLWCVILVLLSLSIGGNAAVWQQRK